VLLCLTLFAYSTSFPSAFLGDDVTIVRDNPAVQEFRVAEILTTDYWGPGVNSGLYRPLTMLSLALNRLLLGAGPAGFRAVNVLLHVAVVLFCFRFLLAAGWGGGAAFLAAAFFAVHPIHGEVVNLAVGRSELLVGLFVLLGLLASRTPGRCGGLAVLGCYGAALLAKEHAVTFPGLLLVTDLYFSRRAGRPFLAELQARRWVYQGLLIITVCWLVLHWRVGVATGVPPDAIYATDNPAAGLVWPARVLTALKIQLFYLSKLLLPLGLTGVYSRSSLAVVESLKSPWAWVGLMTATGMAAACWRGFRLGAGYALGVAFYVVAFAVTSQVFFPTAVYLAERFAYLPSVGLFAGLTWSGARLASQCGVWGQRLALGAACAALLGFGGWSAVRNTEFRSELTMWTAAAERAPDNTRALYFLGNAQRQSGQVAAAASTYRQAIASDPEFPDVYVSYADHLMQQGRFAEAAEQASKAVAFPGIGPGHLLLARAQVELGEFREALHWLDQTRGLFVGHVLYWETRALTLAGLGDLPAALEAYRSAAGRGQRRPEVAQRLGESLLRGQMLGPAEEVLRAGLSLQPNAKTANLLGVCLALQGKARGAVALFQYAVELDPGHQGYRDNLARAQEGLGTARNGSTAPSTHPKLE